MKWMKLEPIIQSEVKSERKTPTQYNNRNMEFGKMVMMTLYDPVFWTLWERARVG